MRTAAWILTAAFVAGPVPAAAQDGAFPATMPKTFIECEGSGPCTGLWTFAGLRGQAQWPKDGAAAVLSVVRFTPERIVIKRSDTANPGFTAEYVGALNGDTMNGTVTWVWPGHWGNRPKTGIWHATVDTTLVLPTIVARAEAPNPRRFNLNGTWRASNPAWLGGTVLPVLHVLQQGERVQITAADSTSGFETVHYDGRYAGGALTGNLLAVGDDADAAVTGQPAAPTATNLTLRVDNPDVISVPDGYLYRTSEPGPGDAPCDAANTSRTAPQYAFLRGRAAYGEHDRYATAACWFHAAAMRGDARSQAILAMLFEQGAPGVPRDDAQALRWAKASAAQNDYRGDFALATLYRAGRGTPADPAAADFWQAKAHKDYAADPDVAAALLARDMRSVGGMLLGAMAAGAIFGAFF